MGLDRKILEKLYIGLFQRPRELQVGEEPVIWKQRRWGMSRDFGGKPEEWGH